MAIHSELVFHSDSLRNSSDIRRIPKSKLTDYQMQLRNIKNTPEICRKRKLEVKYVVCLTCGIKVDGKKIQI